MVYIQSEFQDSYSGYTDEHYLKKRKEVRREGGRKKGRSTVYNPSSVMVDPAGMPRPNIGVQGQ